MWIEVGVGWLTLVLHLGVIKLTFQMKYYSVELGYIAYGVKTSPPYTRGQLIFRIVYRLSRTDAQLAFKALVETQDHLAPP